MGTKDKKTKYILFKDDGSGGPKPCAFFAQGNCKSGDACKFTHVVPGSQSSFAAAPPEALTESQRERKEPKERKRKVSISETPSTAPRGAPAPAPVPTYTAPKEERRHLRAPSASPPSEASSLPVVHDNRYFPLRYVHYASSHDARCMMHHVPRCTYHITPRTMHHVQAVLQH